MVLLVASACADADADADADSGSGMMGGSESTTGEPCGVVHDGELRIDETTDLTMVEPVRVVQGGLIVIGLAASDLQVLSCLEEVEGDVRIIDNTGLVTLAGLDRLREIRADDGDAGIGNLIIAGNPLLQSLVGLDQLETVQALRLEDNTVLASIGLPSLATIEHGIRLGGCSGGEVGDDTPASASGDNPLLTGLDGLDALQQVGGLWIHGQQALVSLARLRELAEAGTEFAAPVEIGLNPLLPTSEITSFADAAGLDTVVACQNADDAVACACPSD